MLVVHGLPEIVAVLVVVGLVGLLGFVAGVREEDLSGGSCWSRGLSIGHDAGVDDWADFFIAPDDESAAAVKGVSPRPAFKIVPVGIYDPADAAVEWESLFTGDSPQELMRAGEPQVLTEITNDGYYVFVMSERLQALLADEDPLRLKDVARKWSHLRRADGEFVEEGEAVSHLAELASLARTATGQGARLYCSVR
ncbi:hypothetical protein OG612_39015 [Streptomyces sp. NBC_01527]|uniref:hypothetical protein n=1 Tax=unclassified Streptomyces TaxID=2593676 RepID=UPI002E158C10|nr:hypothetical protein OG763_03925 [Streptomyces sp. NBC_01230]